MLMRKRDGELSQGNPCSRKGNAAHRCCASVALAIAMAFAPGLALADQGLEAANIDADQGASTGAMAALMDDAGADEADVFAGSYNAAATDAANTSSFSAENEPTSGAASALAVGVLKVLADTDTTAPVYTCDDGWAFSYEINADGTATILDVTAAGAPGTVAIPSSIEGHDVTTIGKLAFYNEGGTDLTASMTGVVIPSTVTTLEQGAFMGSGLTTVSIPSSVREIPASCFAGCSDLAQVTFEGATIGYIGSAAFSGCSSLTRLEIPELTTTVGNEEYRIGPQSFYRCASLETIVFYGNPNTKSSSYIAKSNCFEYCDALKNLVYYCPRSNIPRATSGDRALDGVSEYVTLWFYANEDDAKAARDPLYHITCHNSTRLQDIVNNELDRADIVDSAGNFVAKRVWDESGEFPSLPAGQTWGVTNYTIQSLQTKLANTYRAVPAQEDDLKYGFVTSKTNEAFVQAQSQNTFGSNSYPVYYLDSAGNVPDIGELIAYDPRGNEFASTKYKLVFERNTTVTNADGTTSTAFAAIEGTPTQTGLYRVRAEGTAASNKGTYTQWLAFNVNVFSPTIKSYAKDDVALNLGDVSTLAAKEARKNDAKCAVVVPVSDWRYQLIGAALAGVGSGIVLFDNQGNYSNHATTALVESKVNAVEVVGSTSIVPESKNPASEAYLMDYINERGLQYKTRYNQDSTVQELADQAYTTIKKLADRGNTMYGDGWGTTAIVASPNAWARTLSIAQYAYTQKAPVFFVQDDGLLSATDLGYLKSDGFQKVVVAGDESYVSAACEANIKSACSLPVERLFDGADDTAGAALASAPSLADEQKSVFLADADDAAAVSAAATAAAATGGLALPCACSADSKRIQDYLRQIIVEKGQTSIANVYFVGDFSSIDSGIVERVSAMWKEPLSTTIVAGDTVVSDDCVYKIAKGAETTLVRVRDSAATTATVEPFSYAGRTYSVTSMQAGALSAASKLNTLTVKTTSFSVPASAFKSAPSLKKVAFGTTKVTIGASAFANCSKLQTVTGSAGQSIGASAFEGCAALRTCALLGQAKSVGAKTFSGCKMLSSARLTAATSVGAEAFSGCTRLASAAMPKAASVGASTFKDCKILTSFSAAKATSVGQNAFSGCKKLKSVTLAACKTLGASAFKSCAALSTVAFAKVTTVGKNAFQGCTSLKTLRLANAKTLGAQAFRGCTRLKTVTLPKTTSIGAQAFQSCTSLTSVALSATGLKLVGSKAFYGCKKLKKVALKTKKLTAKNVGSQALKGLPASAKVSVPKAKVKAYKTLFVKKGLSKKATVTA